MRIAIDAMGGDDAPQAIVDGACAYADAEPKHQLILVGQTAAINNALAGRTYTNILVVEAPDVIAMDDKISALREKPNDSMNVSARLVKDGQADAVVLCGNTGCSVSAAQLHLRRIPGVKRAGILTPLPNLKGFTWVCDCGANAVGKAEHLAQFGLMASIFLKHYDNKCNASVGVLSIGSEDSKGDELTHETLGLLREMDVNLVGNVEGTDLFSSELDIAVCDGFTGNVVLKTAEGLIRFLKDIIKEEIHNSLVSKVGGLLVKPAFKRVHTRTHWSYVGGCLLLGVNGVTIIGHGRSDPTAVENAIRQAARCIQTDVIKHICEGFAALSKS